MEKIINKKLDAFLKEHKKKSEKYYAGKPKLTEKDLEYAIEQTKQKNKIVEKVLSSEKEMKRIEKMLEATE